MSSEYDKIYLNQSRFPGRMRIADSGLGWKPQQIPGATTKSTPFLLPSDELSTCHWSRGSRGYELRIDTKNKGVIMLDGFDSQDLNGLKHELSKNFNLSLEHKEHALRGWNWGKTQLSRNELVFNVANKPAFELPYSEITNTNLSGKGEVSIELNMTSKSVNDLEKTGDELVEVKLWIPGNVDAGDDQDENENKDESTEKTNGDVTMKDVKSIAEVFVDELKSKADITQVTGPVIVSFGEILFLTPRGRYDLDFYADYLRLRGKTYDYKLQYTQIQRVFSLPKTDGMHHLMILQVDPPLRQGQTKYNFLTLQFDAQEEIEVELNLDDEEFESTYKGKFNRSYSSNTHLVLANMFRGFTERRVVLPGSFVSKDSMVAVSCSLKANEGQIYPLEKCLLFVNKPTVLIPYSEIQSITFSRVGQGSAQRTFDMEVTTRGNGPNHTFGNIDRAEQPLLENFFEQKNIKVRNDEKIAQQMLANAMAGDSDGDVDMGSADEDESPDEDFNSGGSDGDSDSDVDEEYDSDAPVSDDEPETKKQKTE
ncbi:FACT complex subunit [Martiniozyma asiatica (nom. inval.)]|nr:FACT complex subunit [Martiniozyma asiatica]